MRIIASGEFAESLLLCARGNPPDSFWTENALGIRDLRGMSGMHDGRATCSAESKIS
jgi:hypothetical protein